MSTTSTPGNGGSTASTPYPTGSGPTGTGGTQQRATETIDRLATTAHDKVDRISARAASVADRVGNSGGQYYEQTREYVVANPMRTLGIAVLAGFLLGRLMR
jgi:ElaB/YqjD/DUF883 family membrane-anchored ribosome-binding protein